MLPHGVVASSQTNVHNSISLEKTLTPKDFWWVQQSRFLPGEMSELMDGLEFVWTCMDDAAMLSGDSWEDHAPKTDLALTRLSEAGLKANAAKSHLGLGEAEHLGHLLKREAVVKPVLKKIRGTLQF
jgi:hypothetical protein